jgi:hypothetical protein
VRVAGIDPGVSGALALHDGGKLTAVEDMPVYDGRTDPVALTTILEVWQPDVVYMEHTQPMPRNGNIASFSLGMNSGIIIGVVGSLQHPFVRVRPVAWKRKMSVLHMDKNAVRGTVREIYPEWADTFKRTKDHNRAEAVLISRYGVTTQLQEGNDDRSTDRPILAVDPVEDRSHNH